MSTYASILARSLALDFKNTDRLLSYLILAKEFSSSH